MRYFAIMSDGSIKPTEGVYSFHKAEVNFNIDGKFYKTSQTSRYIKTWNDQNGWVNATDVSHLIILNEEEDNELNYFQSTDFNAGVIYNQVERALVKSNIFVHSSCCNEMRDKINIPIIQLFPKGCTTIEECKTIEATLKAVSDHFNAVYGNRFNLEFVQTNKVKQYIEIFYTIKRKEQYKEMTVAEIEAELGYKIKIIEK